MLRTAFRLPPSLLALLLAALVGSASAEVKLARNFVGEDFENEFKFFTKDDPTHGTVNYVNKEVGKTLGIVESRSDYFRMSVDTKSARATGRGRNSVRIVSKDLFADGVYILDVDHMPVGCGTWPAYWTTVTDGWPKGGEIDIIEGSNALPLQASSAWDATFANIPANLTGITQTYSNTASLHTIDTCNIKDVGLQTGQQASWTCDAKINNNQGCGVEIGDATWGNGWNAADGGYYVMWRDFQESGQIYVWAFPRRLNGIPAEITDASATTLNPANWNVRPMANFTIPHCEKKTFGNHHIIFNTALCGDLAGNTFASSGCPGTCADFVINTPGAFVDAWWGIRGLRVYTSDGKVASNGMPRWQAAVIAIVVLIAVGLATFAIIFCVRRRRRNARINDMHRTEMLVNPSAGSSAAGRFNDNKLAPYVDVDDPNLAYNPNGEGAARRRSSVVPFVDVPVADSQSSTRRPSHDSRNPTAAANNRNSMLSAKAPTESSRKAPSINSPVAFGGGEPSKPSPKDGGKAKMSRRDRLKDPRIPDVLKVGDGGSVWRSPDATLPGETKASVGMSQWNALGGSSTRRGSVASSTHSGREPGRMSKSRAGGGSGSGGSGTGGPATPSNSNRNSVVLGQNNPFNSPLANNFPGKEDVPMGRSGGGRRRSSVASNGSGRSGRAGSDRGGWSRKNGQAADEVEGDGWDSWDEERRR